MSYPDFLLDKRVVNRNMAKGLVNKGDLDEALAKLPDVAGDAEPCLPEEPAPASDESSEE